MTTLSAQRLTLTLAALAAFGLAGTAAHAQTKFTAGNLAISVVGDGVSTLANTGNPIFINEITTGGTLVQSINTGIFSSGTATSEGALSLSGNGKLLTVAGYATTSATSLTSSTTVARSIAEISANGVATSSAFTDASFSGNNIRSSATVDGSTVYATGGVGGVRSTTFGSGTSTQVESQTANTRVVNVVNGNVFFSTGSATGNAGIGIYSLGAVGSAPPVTPTVVAITGTGSSPYDFYFASATDLFIADDRTTTAGGLLEFKDSGSGFALANTFNPAAGVGLRSLTGNGKDIFGVTTDGFGSVVDFNIAAGTFSTIFTNTTANTAIRGVDFAPVSGATPPAVPEASTTVSFGLLLVLGLGGFAVAKKRSVRA